MAYTDFSFADLKAKFGLQYNISRFFSNIPPVQPSDFLFQQLELSKHFPLLRVCLEIRKANFTKMEMHDHQ